MNINVSGEMLSFSSDSDSDYCEECADSSYNRKKGRKDQPEITDEVSAIMNTVYFISEDNEKERTEFQNFDCGCSDSKAGKCLKPCAWTERISLEDSI